MYRYKQKLLTFFTFFLFTLSPLSSETIFTIASYNIENLFDLQKNGDEYEEYIPFTHDWNLNNFHKKLNNISNVISTISADIIVLNEIENSNVLKLLKKELLLKNCHYKYSKIGNKPNKTNTNVAILSKYPINDAKYHSCPKINKYNSRNILEVEINIKDHKLKVFALHFPSKKHPESFRISAALALRNILSKLKQNCDYIIAGDFNSNYNEAETFYTTQHDDTKGVTAINHTLNTVINSPNQPLCFFRPEEGKKYSNNRYHFNPWIDVNPQYRYNYIYKGSKNSLDHILISESLFDSLGISYVDSSFQPFNWNGKLFNNEIPFRWEILRTKNGTFHTGHGYSDHLPVIAKFIISPYKTKNQKTTNCINYNNSKLLCDFETGIEGWISMSSETSIEISRNESTSGKNSLNIFGKTSKNSKVAKISIKPIKHKASQLTFMMKGKGQFAIIINQKNKKDISYSGNFFEKKSSSVRYNNIEMKTWKEIKICLSDIDLSKRWEIVIKSYKGEELDLLIDNMEFK